MSSHSPTSPMSPESPQQKYDAAGSGVVTFVNRFTVHSAPEEFERVFAEISEFMIQQPGFLQYTLSRSIDEEKRDQYINIALWTDVESWQRAVAHPGFQDHAKEIRSRTTNAGELYAPRQSYSVT
ncbi:antibiotic biosynthesis monooxygenase family protein [Streptomyces sp. NPDC048290]|uniref:antibiotic biosynthesis monooxygenase family protein n=1 Tax=Streptomyces sp. NPDC048290 TaxID=3155811 RepID=UPI00343A1BB7